MPFSFAELEDQSGDGFPEFFRIHSADRAFGMGVPESEQPIPGCRGHQQQDADPLLIFRFRFPGSIRRTYTTQEVPQ
jgi:hypothetical protein